MNPRNRNATITNFVWLILVTWLIRAWFYYYPTQATKTLQDIRVSALTQMDKWFDDDSIYAEPVVNQPIIFAPNSIITDDNMMTGESEIITGEIMDTIPTSVDTWTIIVESGAADSVRSELDAFTTLSDSWAATITTWDQSITPTDSTNDNVISIIIGDKEVMIDGNPDEDVIINAGTYRVIVQKK